MSRSCVPIVDFEALRRGDPNEAARLEAACREWGAFQLVGHGIPADLIERFSDEMQRFFALPPAAKEAVRRGEENTRGYNDQELTKNAVDWKEVFDFGFVPHPELPDDHPDNRTEDGTNLWPADLPGFEATCKAYFDACSATALELLDRLCTALGLAPGRLREHFAGVHTSFLRLNHYAPCADAAPPDAPTVPEAGRLGVGHHTDAGVFTFVCQQGADGLQVERDGSWYTIEVVPGALVVNLGDMLQVWSNDRLKSPLHRVVANRTAERYSAPFFYNPAYDTICEPLPEFVAADEPARFRPIRWGDFRAQRAAGDYADLGEEVQLAHYRIEG